ncbi:MAG: YcaO-like family protein [Thermoanaerobaculia bacterium]
MDLKELALSRRSTRALTGRALELDVLRDIVDTACARIECIESPSASHDRFSYPTAGGLASTRIFIFSWNVRRLEPGVYAYEPRSRALQKTAAELPARARLTEIAEQQEWVLGASAAVLMATDRERSEAKYAALSEPLTLMETGHCAQMLALAAANESVAAVAIGGFRREDVRPLVAPFEPRLFLLLSPPVPATRTDQTSREIVLASAAADCEHRRYDIDGEPFVVARRRVPGTMHWATGTNFGSEETAITKAAAEAREIWTALDAVPRELVYTHARALPDRAIDAPLLLLDLVQQHAVARGAVDPAFNADGKRHWLLVHDLKTGEPLWVPASSALLGQRFFDWTVLPSSSGIACAPTVERAIRHAFHEMLERRFCVYLDDAPFERVPHAHSTELRLRRIGSLFYCRSGESGTAVADQQEDAVRSAWSETLAKRLQGGRELPAADPRPLFHVEPGESIEDALARSGIRIAVCHLQPQDEYEDLHPSWPVVKLIPFFDRGADA